MYAIRSYYEVVEVESKLATANTDSAMQLLSLFQQEARLIDFLQEDVNGFRITSYNVCYTKLLRATESRTA